MKSTLALVLFTAVLSPASAQQADTLTTLLSEVRQLRLALEKSAIVTPKIQLTLQRMQMQQDVVARVARQLDEARDQIGKSASQAAAMTARLQDAERRLAQALDDTSRKRIETDITAIKAAMTSLSDTQQRARESELASRLNAEQARLHELNDRLNTLEGQLDTKDK